MSTTEQKPRCVKSRRTFNGWIIEMDSQSWADLMSGLSIAIDACRDDLDRARPFKALRTALSRG